MLLAEIAPAAPKLGMSTLLDYWNNHADSAEGIIYIFQKLN